MAPKKPSKKQKQLEEQLQREEEERAAALEAFQKDETKCRQELLLSEKAERTEVKLMKNDAYVATMVSKKKQQQLLQKFQEMSKQSTTEKNQLEKQLAQLTRAKDALEKELNDLKTTFKVDSAELALTKKKLEGEMNSQGKCFVCVECARTIYKDRPRNSSLLVDP
jgi:DNA repair exonuclease SbcCD ATPase subunit